MKLYGSIASPYVRRIRLILDELVREYEFEAINIFDQKQKIELQKFSPINRIPLFVDKDLVIWDSLIIAEYLLDETFSLELKKELCLINEMTDAGIQLYQMRKFEIDIEDQSPFSQNNLDRIELILNHFFLDRKEIDELASDWLFCTLDWFEFRSVFPWRELPRASQNMTEFFMDQAKLAKMKKTDPRN